MERGRQGEGHGGGEGSVKAGRKGKEEIILEINNGEMERSGELFGSVVGKEGRTKASVESWG